jgi:hypothetical protein
LNNAIVADYLSKGEKYRMFLLVFDNTEDALSVLQSYLKQSKSNAEPMEEQIYDINDMFNGYVAMAVTDSYLAGIIDLDDWELANEYLAQFIDYIIQSKP